MQRAISAFTRVFDVLRLLRRAGIYTHDRAACLVATSGASRRKNGVLRSVRDTGEVQTDLFSANAPPDAAWQSVQLQM